MLQQGVDCTFHQLTAMSNFHFQFLLCPVSLNGSWFLCERLHKKNYPPLTHFNKSNFTFTCNCQRECLHVLWLDIKGNVTGQWLLKVTLWQQACIDINFIWQRRGVEEWLNLVRTFKKGVWVSSEKNTSHLILLIINAFEGQHKKNTVFQ